MKKALIVVLVIVVVGAAGTATTLYTKTWNPQWNPFRPEPEEVLTSMVGKMEEARTYHMDSDFEVSVDSQGASMDFLIEASFDTDQNDLNNLKTQGEYDFKISWEGMAFNAGFDLIGIGDTTYIKLTTIPSLPMGAVGDDMVSQLFALAEGFKKQWIKIDSKEIEEWVEEYTSQEIDTSIATEQQEELVNEMREFFKGKKFYQVKSELDDEMLESQMMYHYMVSLNNEEIKEMIPELFDIIWKYSEGSYSEEDLATINQVRAEIPEALDKLFEKVGEINAEVWIGQEDNFLYRLKFDKEFDLKDLEAGEGTISLSVNADLSEYNKEMIIEAPKNYKTLQEIFEGLMSDMFGDMELEGSDYIYPY